MNNTPPRNVIEEAERAIIERRHCVRDGLAWVRLVAKLLTLIRKLERAK